MTSSQPRRIDTDGVEEKGRQSHTGNLGVPDRPFSDAEIAQWADLVANGEVGFPAGLSGGQAEALIRAVQTRRRRRLVQFVARAIAQDILRSRDEQQGGNETC